MCQSTHQPVSYRGGENQNPDFAPKYLREKEELLEILTEGDPTLLSRARAVIQEQRKVLKERQLDA